MILTTADKLQVTTASAVDAMHMWASYVDDVSDVFTPGRGKARVTTATDTDLVAAPSSGYRRIKQASIRNTHASSTNTVTIKLHDGTNPHEVLSVALAAGESLTYDEGEGWRIIGASGGFKMLETSATVAVGAVTVVVLGSDVTNNNAVANTIADVTGLSFAVTAGNTYKFRFVIPYTSAATTTGSRWAINGPASPTLLSYTSHYCLTATSETVNYATAYDIPAASNASSLTAGNVAVIEGVIKPSSDGTVIARFASEVSSSAIVAKAGATLEWYRAA